MEFVGGVDPCVNNINSVAQIGQVPSEGMFGTDCYQHKHNNILQLQQICRANIDEIRSPILKHPTGAAVDWSVQVFGEPAEGESGRQKHSHCC